jgi:hypothetical protein
LTTQELAIVETNITRWALYDQGRGRWRGRRREGIVVGRSVDIDVAKRKEGTHVVWNDIKNATTRQELADKETCGSSNEHDDAPKSGQDPFGD